jgi:hypothetical protein
MGGLFYQLIHEGNISFKMVVGVGFFYLSIRGIVIAYHPKLHTRLHGVLQFTKVGFYVSTLIIHSQKFQRGGI